MRGLTAQEAAYLTVVIEDVDGGECGPMCDMGEDLDANFSPWIDDALEARGLIRSVPCSAGEYSHAVITSLGRLALRLHVPT